MIGEQMTVASVRFQRVEKRLSVVLTEVADSVPAEGVTLHNLLARLGECGLLLLAMILTFPFLLPFSIPDSWTTDPFDRLT
jgi:hypothetical protein